jgi:Tol biopolymer transport system component/predicted Ser/Thr protein kinase
MIGQTIAHYKITEKLGEGGMGVVYKADDTKLDRPVALKFLAAHLVSDEEVRKRFEREAKAAAALNHPNICHVYSIDEIEGKTFIAMAFLEGEGLDRKIEAGPLKLKDALGIAIQTAQGLQAAHEKGIVHRDIKPANLMVTGSGSKQHVTIMDFGLAQLADRSKLTRMDETMGTVTYMSPEQTYGTEIDHRSDIWSLGVVTYEMVTGQQPFKGHYDKAVMYSITNEPPEPMTALRTGVPMELELLVNKCIAKDADERYQHTDELLLDLQGLKKKLESGKSTIMHAAPAGTVVTGTHAGPTQAPGQVENPSLPGPLAKYRVIENIEERDDSVVYHAEDTQLRRLVDVKIIPQSAAQGLKRKQLIRYAALFAAGIVLTALIGYAMGWLSPAGTPADIPLRRFSFAPAHLLNAAISPNGRHIAYIERGLSNTLWVHDLASKQPRIIEGAVPARSVFWSADSQFIGFQEGGDLKKISREGGPAVSVCELPDGRIAGAGWSPDGESIVFSAGRPFTVYEVPSRGGSPKQLFDRVEADGSRGNTSPRFLPRRGGSRAILFNVRSQSASDVFVRDLESGETKKLAPGVVAAYSPSGHIVYGAAPNQPDLWALPFSLGSLEATGEPFPIAQQAAEPSVAVDGTLLYADSAGAGLRQLRWRDRDGKPQGTIGQPQETIRYPALSPDGKRVATWSRDDGANDIWVHEVDRPVKTRLTTFGYDVWPTWSPSGNKIGFASGRTGERDIYVKSADGSGEPKALLLVDAAAEYLTDWSRDEKTLLFWRRPRGGGTASGSGTVGDILSLQQKSDGSYEEAPFLTSEFEETTPQFSPDERFVAYTSDESGRREVYIQAFPEGGSKRQVSVNGGTQPRWRADGKELYYVEGERLMAVPVSLGPALTVGSPKELFSSPGLVWQGDNYLTYDVTPDGQRFVLAERVEGESRREIQVVQNWYEEFRGREQK